MGVPFGRKGHSHGRGAGVLVVFGGKYGVPDKDRFTFLKDEMRLIGKSLKREIPVLGICLGAQLVAHELGAEVAHIRKANMNMVIIHSVQPRRVEF